MKEEDLFVCIPTDQFTSKLNLMLKKLDKSKFKIVIIKTKVFIDYQDAVNLECISGIPNIYSWWNRGIEFVLSQDGRYVAILNDDIEFSQDQLGKMLNELRLSNAILCHSRNSNGGRWGHAFILDLKYGVKPDDKFTWWYGDDDLKIRAKKRGKVIESSVEIKHLTPNLRTSNSELLQLLAKQDEKLFYQRYPFYRVRDLLVKLTPHAIWKLRKVFLQT